MRFWKRKANTIQPLLVSTKQLELETAKEMLAEIFHARREDVEEMIHSRLEQRSCRQDYEEERLWPASFCLGESRYGNVASRSYPLAFHAQDDPLRRQFSMLQELVKEMDKADR